MSNNLTFSGESESSSDENDLVCLITGSNQGIGYACVTYFAQQGLKVIGTARTEEKAESAKTRLSALGLNVDYQLLDISSAESVHELAEYIEDRYKRLDVLINNAGIWVSKPPEQSSLDEDIATIQSVFNVNTMGTLRCMQAFIPLMRKNDFGRIVNITSALGKIQNMSGNSPISYAISKSSIHVITKIVVDMFLSEDPVPNITVNCLRPGFVRTQMHYNTPLDVPSRLGLRWRSLDEVAREVFVMACNQTKETNGKLFHAGKEEEW